MLHSFRVIVLGSVAVLCSVDLHADNWSGLLKDNARASVDLSTRASRQESHVWSLQAIGLDVHKVFSGTNGDIGTLILQPYVLRIDNSEQVPGIFESDHDWALQWRIANFNYTGFGHGRFNIRLGHFELPFGLEQVVQTNGTLEQVRSPTSLKADWGISVNGHLPQLEYEIAYMTGSGNELDIDPSGVVVGRIGLPQDSLWWMGISGLEGEFQGPVNSISRDRYGFDFGIRLPFGVTFMAEQVIGHDQGRKLRRTFGQLNWHNAVETLNYFGQWNRDRAQEFTDWKISETVSLGMRFEPNQHWSLSLLMSRVLSSSIGSSSLVTGQIRYRS